METKSFFEIEILFEEKKYEECLLAVEQLMEESSPELSYQVLKGKCLAALNRINEIDMIWSAIDFENPVKADIEAIELIIKQQEYRKDYLQAKRFSRIIDFAVDDINYREEEKSGFLSTLVWEKEMWDYYWGMSAFYFSCSDFILAEFYYSMYLLERNRDISHTTYYGDTLLHHRNVGDIRRVLVEKKDATIAIVLDRPENYERYMNVARTLKDNGRKVLFITLPIEVELEKELSDISEYIDLSLDNLEIVDGIPTYVPVQFLYQKKYYDNTKLALLSHLSKQMSDHFLFVLGERAEFSRLRSKFASRKELHYICKNQRIKNTFTDACFGYVGDYGSYLSIFYGFNLRERLRKPSKCELSIILPVRNNASTLPYTLRTCLEQGDVDYEIVVCDNSDTDNCAIEELIKNQFLDVRVKYIRTPRVLPITKSFEFAYLQAEGEFVIPIGADDGILFGALETVVQVKNKIKEKDGEEPKILLWDRISYIWDDFKSSGKAGEMVIPSSGLTESVTYEKISTKKQLEDLVMMPGLMYGLPLLYLNSGFKRSYLLEMLERTGAILDGHSQDVYTGIVNLVLNENYYYIKKPITMAAISDQSSGANSISGSISKKVALERGKEDLLTNIMMPVQRDIEDFIHPSDGDVANMICQILRLIDMDCISFSFLGKIPWFVIGCNIANQIQYMDVNGTKVKRQLVNSISVFSKEDGKRMQVGFDHHLIEVKHYEKIEGKDYFKGRGENGSLTLDASEFNVHDVYEACALYESQRYLVGQCND